MKGIGLVAIGLVLMAIAFGMGLERAVDHAEAKGNATAAIRADERPEESVIISNGIGNAEGLQELQTKLNAWSKENHGKVRITGHTQSGDNRFAVVIIWYVRTD